MEDVRYIPGIIQTRAMGAELPEDDDDKYWIRVLASNDKLDRHNSIMDPETTLRNYEKDAKTKPGVALKDHHTYRSFGYGRSANAVLTDKNELFIDFYILKNMEYEGSREFKSSEQLIRAIEHELVNQVSIGFYDAREICNISKKPIRRYSFWDYEPDANAEKSPYKPGKMYEIDGKQVKATYTVYDARLKEVSLVEFGSNRNTAIEKKREMRSFMEELLMTDQEWIAQLREKLDIPNIKTTDEPDAVVETLEAELTSLREKVEEQKDEIADLTLDAEDGKAYRQARVDEGIKQGVRAHGDDFDEEYHREYYADLPLDKLEKAIESNKKIGDTKLPEGRSTTDDHQPPPEKTQASTRDRRRRGRRR
ncbi:hypothetical protein F4009_05575 [Candidatus Poribacteria bacterium]|nr:hypothetical protein [Candidatus Poribacteria bacterium]MYH83495.1 hypothetical protein [Candidatus Poribacteria bacterium]MYK93457.1 hypothetical protein [Candidatus Poribacteria bacterium]